MLHAEAGLWIARHGLARLGDAWRRLTPPRLRPLLRSRLEAITWTADAEIAALVRRLGDDVEDELGEHPELAALGHDLIGKERPAKDRVAGCIWLTHFPSRETAEALAAILRDGSAPKQVRDQAAWTLGYRQLQERRDGVSWPADAIAVADRALAEAYLAGLHTELEELAPACRHVADPAFHDALAELPDPAAAAAAVDAFCSPKLARVLLGRLSVSACRVAADTLGAEARPALVAWAAATPGIAERTEALFAAEDLDGIRALVAENPMMPQLARRAAWQEANPGVIPVVRALQIARTTAALPPADRAGACRLACGWLAAAHDGGALVESYLYELWRHVAWRAGGDSAIACVEARSDTLDKAPFLLPPYLDALAAAGRFDAIGRTARTHGEVGRAAWLLARGGRPFLALQALRLLRGEPVPEAVAAEALALFLSGRPDLAGTALARGRRVVSVDACWLMNRRPEEHTAARAVAAGDPAALLAHLRPGPAGADPDVLDFALVAERERTLRLHADLSGAAVVLAGSFADRDAVARALEARGAQIVSGPFAKADACVHAPDADVQILARFADRGATLIPLADALPQLAADVKENDMPPFPYPHRIAFLAADLTLPERQEGLHFVAAMAVNALLWDSWIRHPIVSVADYSDLNLVDGDGALLDVNHPGFGDTCDWYFGAARADELLYFQLSLDPAKPAPVRLNVLRPGGREEDFSAVGAGALSQQMMQCLEQWWTSRNLAPPRPLPGFAAGDLLGLVDLLDRALTAAKNEDQAGVAASMNPPRPLAVPFFRVMQELSPLDDGDLEQAILSVDPSDPPARRGRFLASLDQKGADRTAILAVAAEAPMYGKPHLSIHGKEIKKIDDELPLRHQGIAAQLLPTNPWAQHNYAIQLRDGNRNEEAVRYCRRATRHSPSFYQAHIYGVNTLRNCMRAGEAFLEGRDQAQEVLDLWEAGRLSPFDWPAKYNAGMVTAELHFDIGRIEEAIEIGERTMSDMEDPDSGHESFKWAVDMIDKWRSDPEMLATAYAREGWFRGDPGRVIAGFARGRVRFNDDVEMLVESLVKVGKEDLALCAFWHWRGAQGAGGRGRLAGAKALLLAGDADAALDEIQNHQLWYPQSRAEAEINRLYRLGVLVPVEAWDAAIRRRLDLGARRLAWLAARDAADFIPGMDKSAAAKEALAWGAARPFDESCLSPLPMTKEVAAYFAQAGTSLKEADQLAQAWIPALPPPSDEEEAMGAHAAGVISMLGQALARYLWLSSQPPSPLLGAYRQMATGLLQLLQRARGRVEDDWIRGLLETLEQAGAAADPWLFDTWLLRVERALDLEDRTGGKLGRLVDGLARVSHFLRGDERTAFEYRMALDLKGDPTTIRQAADLFERTARAVGTSDPWGWLSEVAEAARPPAEALDAHWTAARACTSSDGNPWVRLARALFAGGKAQPGFDALIDGLSGKTDDWRNEQIASVRAAFERAQVGVPMDFAAAQTEGLRRLQGGDLDGALRCFRWCSAYDGKNQVILKNIGITAARLGRVHEALRVFSKADRREGPKWAGQALLEAKKYAEATLAYRYASVYFTQVDEWKMLGGAAWYQEDDETAAEAYEKIDALSGGRSDVNTLHTWATSLYNAGIHGKCLPVAERLLRAAGNDPTYASCGHHAMARALLGLDRADEAMPHAERAVQMNPLADNTKEFGETLQRAQRNDPYPPKPLRAATPEGQAFHAIEEGDFQRAVELAQAGDSWGLWRAALQASDFRFDSDNERPVAPAAFQAMNNVLQSSVGNPLKDAVVARAHALRVQENAYLQIDPPPPMGTRLPRERFEAMFAERAAGARPAAQPAMPAFDQARATRDAQAAQAQMQAGMGGDDDPVVFPGQKVPKLSDYVRLMKGMQAGDMMGALAKAGLDMGSYSQVAMAWGQKMAQDPMLVAKFQRMMTS